MVYIVQEIYDYPGTVIGVFTDLKAAVLAASIFEATSSHTECKIIEMDLNTEDAPDVPDDVTLDSRLPLEQLPRDVQDEVNEEYRLRHADEIERRERLQREQEARDRAQHDRCMDAFGDDFVQMKNLYDDEKYQLMRPKVAANKQFDYADWVQYQDHADKLANAYRQLMAKAKQTWTDDEQERVSDYLIRTFLDGDFVRHRQPSAYWPHLKKHNASPP